MSGVCHIKIYVQVAFCEHAPSFNLHIYFCMAELLPKKKGKKKHEKKYDKRKRNGKKNGTGDETVLEG